MGLRNSKWLMRPPQNIIVRMPNWIGDVVMATPVLADLKNHWKDTKMTAMCQSNVASLLTRDPNIDELFAFHRPSGWLHRQHRRNIIDPLRHGEYDLGVLLTNSFSSAWWFWRGNVKNRVGYAANCRSFLLDHSVSFPANMQQQHLVVTYKQLLEPLGIPLSSTLPQLYVTSEEMQEAESLLRRLGVTEKHVRIGINPGAAFGSAKCWLPERFREVTKRLLDDSGNFVIYFGDPVGAKLVSEICAEMPERVINLAGKTTLRQLMALIKSCTVFLTNDSGPMHISAAVKTPLLALFGSTSDVRTGPYCFGKVIHKHVECSPCYKRICPIDFRCMKRIEVDEVYEELKKMINEKRSMMTTASLHKSPQSH